MGTIPAFGRRLTPQGDNKGNNMLVYVQDKVGKAISPTKRCGRVGYLRRHGLAVVVMLEPFTIRLLYDVHGTEHVQAATLGVDTGAKHIGLSASTKKSELYSSQVELRDDVSELLTARREIRRGRRGRRHNWYRPARWQNRANAREEHLPTSIVHLAESHVLAVKNAAKILPLRKIVVEIGKFDVQKIKNPDIEGVEYQRGPQMGWKNLKAYARWRDGEKCRICGKSSFKDNANLEVHHIIQRAYGGTDVPENVVTLCEDCHHAHHANLSRIKFRIPPQHKNEAHMNAMRKYLVERLREEFPDCEIEVTYGYITAMARREHGIEKSHANDAFCIAGNFWAKRNDYNIYLHRFVRRHDRSTHLQIIKSPRKLSKAVQKRLTETEWKNGYRPQHRMLKVVKGFRRMDTVRYKGALWHLSSLRNTGWFKLMRHGDGVVKDGAGYRHLTRVCGACGTITTERIKERSMRDSSQR